MMMKKDELLVDQCKSLEVESISWLAKPDLHENQVPTLTIAEVFGYYPLHLLVLLIFSSSS